jgi:hypothetical protein
VVENVETNVGKIDSLTATCQKHDNVIASGWPGGIVADLGDEITRFPFFNPNRSPIITRSTYLPPTKSLGPDFAVGRDQEAAQDFNDSISLIEMRRGVDNMQQSNDIMQDQQCDPPSGDRRGRSRKPRGRPPNKKSMLGVPKCVQFAKVVKEGNGRQRSRKRRVETTRGGSRNGVLIFGSSEDVSNTVVPNTFEGVNLEVVLPGFDHNPNPEPILLRDSSDEGDDPEHDQIFIKANKLLAIQKTVGFGFS